MNRKNSDLCYTPVYEQFNTCDVTAVIRCEERDGFCDFVRIAHPPQRYGVHDTRQQLLVLFVSLRSSCSPGARRVDRTRTNGTDTDLALFKIDCPCACERPYRGLGRAINTEPFKSLGSKGSSIYFFLRQDYFLVLLSDHQGIFFVFHLDARV